MSDAIQCLTVRSQQADHSIIGPLHDAIDFLIDNDSRLLAVLARTSRQGSAREWILTLAEGDGAKPLAHTPARDHLASGSGDTLQVVFRPCRDVPNRHLLSGTSTQGRYQLRFQVLFRVIVSVVKRCILRHTERLATWDDRDP